MTKLELIEQLQLEPHVEGGYFKRSFGHHLSATLPGLGERLLMSSIYYMLTDDSPIGHFHRNRSDIIHYWHAGSPMRYWLIDRAGHLSTAVLGPDLTAGQQLQLHVPGGYWKASRLESGEFGLLSEAVSPGFDFNDMQLADADQMQEDYPELWSQIKFLCKT